MSMSVHTLWGRLSRCSGVQLRVVWRGVESHPLWWDSCGRGRIGWMRRSGIGWMRRSGIGWMRRSWIGWMRRSSRQVIAVGLEFDEIIHVDTCAYIYVAVLGRNQTLFHCVFRSHDRIQSAIAQNFGKYSWVCPVHMSPALNRSCVLSLVPRPHPLTRRNGLVNQVEFIGLAHAFATL